MVGDGHIQVAHEAGQLQFFVAGVDRNHHHAVAAAHIVRLVIIHAEQQDVGDGIVVVQPTQQVGIAQCLVCGRRVFIAAGDRAGTAGRGRQRTQFRITDLAQQHVRIDEAAAKYHQHQAQKQNSNVADQTDPLFFLILIPSIIP